MILYSLNKEREKRFLISLKIILPFISALIILNYIIFSKLSYDYQEVILFLILILFYAYYVAYLIFFAFKNSIIDEVSKAFSRDEIVKILKKTIKKNRKKNAVLIKIENFEDINLRYGYQNGDKLLEKFVYEITYFFKENGFKNLPIGRCSSNIFMFLVDCKTTKLQHMLRTFERKLSNEGINNIEVKIKFADVLTTYDKNYENILNFLMTNIFNLDSEKENYEAIKLDTLDELVLYAIEKSNFEVKKQTIKSIKDDKDLLSLYVYIKSDEIGNISKNRVLNIAAKNNYEIRYDLKVIEFIADNFEFIKYDRFFIEISPVSLRNESFKNEIFRMITNKIIDPNKIVFEINEKTFYSDLNRFKEIIEQFKEYGFKIALNQFLGLNYSVEYFKSLNFDYLIYDIEINKNLSDKKINEIVKSFNNISDKLNVKTIAKFIDKENLYEEYKNNGIDYIQGFYIDRPKSI
ncbi:diguanylate phosphodiesterase [Campylobacter blaseri]|uniref:GGDEF domain-containing protein n=1 Tax=Campylobacter blaseri TaxID=2042961 RepID=A0A2P8R3J2_9BACT|nr:EAL domain-containing protein [Campylobacter blaseri]PSM53059.1 GGDEF domain-containing protein [Campylobacter blaseri]PSM54526.1 GGDEF domain-containing protein [Campylobacter blaseri]QKF85224.1 diguanylate phosphodiesterase [Campylobacter blaseri]